IRISATNRGTEAATLHVLPTLWFRNTWYTGAPKPTMKAVAASGATAIVASHSELAEYRLYVDGDPKLLFTENETNNERLFHQPHPSPFVKDGINDRVVNGRTDAVNPSQIGTKAAAHYQTTV